MAASPERSNDGIQQTVTLMSGQTDFTDPGELALFIVLARLEAAPGSYVRQR